jgi:hypothetical protein
MVKKFDRNFFLAEFFLTMKSIGEFDGKTFVTKGAIHKLCRLKTGDF